MKVGGWHLLFGLFTGGIIYLTVCTYFKGGSWQPLVTPVVLSVAAWIAYRQLEHARHTRCAELLIGIMRWWISDEMSEARRLMADMPNPKDEILELYRKKRINFRTVLKVAEFGESLGVLVIRHYVSKKDIWLLFEDDWEKYYEVFSGYLDELKLRGLDPSGTTFVNFKKLYEELGKVKN